MTHPHHLHATAALWSLRAARRALDEAAAAALTEARQVPAPTTDGLRSSVYGSRSGSGGHGDPTADALVTGVVRAVRRAGRMELLAERIDSTLAWLADRLQAPGDVDPLARLKTALPRLRPSTARELHLWLAEADRKVRGHLGMPPDHIPLAGNPCCPACGLQMLVERASAPSAARTMVCTAGCSCAGDECPCGMEIRAAGVAHIWPYRVAPIARATAEAT